MVSWLHVIILSSYGIATPIIIVCVFCDSNEGYLGSIHGFLTEAVPRAISRFLERCVGRSRGEAIEGFVNRIGTYICYERNPILQSFYLILILGAYFLVVWFGYPRIPCFWLPEWHKYTAFASVSVCLYLWWLACTVSAGIITEDTLWRYEGNYPPMAHMYDSGRVCRTTGLVKPPRSKFCQHMRANVARFDHFCPWLNQAVGQDNYRYFLVFLVAHCLLLVYGALGMLGIFLSEVADKDLMHVHFYNARLGRNVPATRMVVFQYLMGEHWGLFAVGVLCAVMALVLGGFTAYHLWLAARNVTTNESYKWADLRQAYRAYEAARERQIKERSDRSDRKDGAADGAANGAANGTPNGAAAQRPSESRTGPNSGRSTLPEEQHGVGRVASGDRGDGASPKPPPPPPPVVATAGGDAKDGEEPMAEPAEEAEEQVLPYEPFPRNVYDRGIFRNLMEVFFPLTLDERQPEHPPSPDEAASRNVGSAEEEEVVNEKPTNQRKARRRRTKSRPS